MNNLTGILPSSLQICKITKRKFNPQEGLIWRHPSRGHCLHKIKYVVGKSSVMGEGPSLRPNGMGMEALECGETSEVASR